MNNSINQYNLSNTPTTGKSKNEKLAGIQNVNYELINFIDDIPPVTNSQIIQVPVCVTTHKPIVIRQPSPPRRCSDCNCDISPQQEWLHNMCKICFDKIGFEARRRHF